MKLAQVRVQWRSLCQTCRTSVISHNWMKLSTDVKQLWHRTAVKSLVCEVQDLRF